MTDFWTADRLLFAWAAIMFLAFLSDLGIKPELTLGNVLLAAISILIPLTGVVVWICRRLWKNHPFRLRLLDQSLLSQVPSRFHKKCELSIGENTIIVVATSRQETVKNPFDIRFVERKSWYLWWKRRNALHSDIEITKISVPDWEKKADAERDYIGPNNVETSPNGVGGFRVTTHRTKPWIIGEHLEIKLTVKAHSPWHGFLSFEGRTDRRAFGRMPVTVRQANPVVSTPDRSAPPP